MIPTMTPVREMPSSTRPTTTFTPPNTKSIASKGAPALQQRQGFYTNLYDTYVENTEKAIGELASQDIQVAQDARKMLNLLRASSKRIAAILGNSELKTLAQKRKAIQASETSSADFDVQFYLNALKSWITECKEFHQSPNPKGREGYLLWQKWNDLAMKAKSALRQHG
jgi:hypothetical protein